MKTMKDKLQVGALVGVMALASWGIASGQIEQNTRDTRSQRQEEAREQAIAYENRPAPAPTPRATPLEVYRDINTRLSGNQRAMFIRDYDIDTIAAFQSHICSDDTRGLITRVGVSTFAGNYTNMLISETRASLTNEEYNNLNSINIAIVRSIHNRC